MKNTRLKEFLSVISIIFLSAIVSCKPSDNVSKLDVPGGSDNQTEITIPVAPGDDGYKFVDIENGSATGDGSMVDPVNSITLGIQIANASNSDVCVAQGVYNVDSSASTEIIMKEGVSIFGSYKNVNGNWTRDASAETVLQDKADKGGSRTQPLRVILCNSDITNDTVIDGFTIIGARAGKAASAIFCNGGSPTISNNKIDAGGKLNNIELVSGVYCYQSTAVIKDNTITGGFSNSESNGVFCYNANPKIASNVIEAGKSDDSYAIKCFSDSSPSIEGNTLSSQGRIERLGIYEEQNADNNPAVVKDNVFSLSLLSGARDTGLYRDFTDGQKLCKGIDELNNLDSDGLNPDGSVSGNTVQ